ncbi:alpha/beta hydrolase [Mycoplasmatota bacterium WC30]
MKPKLLKYIKKTLLTIFIILVFLAVGLGIYATGSYTALPEMEEAIESLDLSEVNYKENMNKISYTVEDPLMNIIFVPGGLVTPDSYKYLAANLAIEGYNVTISKAIYNLAIFTPNKPNRYIDEDLENVIIGHSLGGVVASMAASGNEDISKVILLGSYPIKDLLDKDTLFITAEHDEGMDPDKFDDSLKYVNDNNVIFNIEEGNHAQFGWYGPQKGDGEAEISTLVQQNIIIAKILEFLQ